MSALAVSAQGVPKPPLRVSGPWPSREDKGGMYIHIYISLSKYIYIYIYIYVLHVIVNGGKTNLCGSRNLKKPFLFDVFQSVGTP